MVKYLQRVPLDISINWHYLHQDAVKTYSKISKRDPTGGVFKNNHLQAYEKEYWRLYGYERIKGKTTKTNCLTKEKHLKTN